MVIAQAPSIRTVTPQSQRVCPRCSAALVKTYHEPECLQCGFADYDYTPPVKIGAKSLMSAGTRYVFRYAGDSDRFADTLCHVRLRRIRNRVVYGVSCPFCRQEMEQSSLSGKRRELREERYRCPQGHRLSLIPSRDGTTMRWK